MDAFEPGWNQNVTAEPVRPLTGVRILDCTRLLPCSFGTQLLADMGAEVIKIEQPGGEIGRQHDRFPTVNRHKLSVTLDLGTPHDRSRLLELLTTADVLLESFRPGVMERFGLAYQDLKDRYPSLVYVSSSGYAAESPTPVRPGHDLNYLATAGVLQPRVGDTPVLSATPVGDLATGMVVAMSVLAALLHSRNTGVGQHISTNMADVSLVLGAVGAGRLPPREGTEPDGIRTWPDVPLGHFPCYGTYETADNRFVSFGNIETKFWEEFLAATGLMHLAEAQFATGTAASAAESAIAEVIRSRTLAEWEDVFANRDVCFAAVRTLREAVGTTDVLDRGLIETRDDDLLIAAFPATFSGTPARVGGVAPEPGEHNILFFGSTTR